MSPQRVAAASAQHGFGFSSPQRNQIMLRSFGRLRPQAAAAVAAIVEAGLKRFAHESVESAVSCLIHKKI
jgi:hypothetical protein